MSRRELSRKALWTIWYALVVAGVVFTLLAARIAWLLR